MKFISKLVAVLAAVMSCASFGADALNAQSFKPVSTWPYMYQDFQQGWITTFQGSKIKYGKLNVSVLNGRAHYIDKGVFMEANISSVSLLTIGDDSYVLTSGGLVQVLRNTEHTAVVLSTRLDKDAMNKVSIGYGKSSIASTQNVTLDSITNDMDYSVNKTMESAVGNKNDGEVLPLSIVKGILYKGMFVPATKADVLAIPGIDKSKVKEYFKSNKVKFSDVESLAALAEFLYTI